MNKDIFAKILANYKANYSMINGQNDYGRDEVFKWPAVKTCIDNWDIEAPDFAEMLKKAMSKSITIIENAIKHPINGLIFLCEQGKTEEVREAFRSLLSDDGDIRDRQSRAEAFNDTINGMLKTIAPEKWSYEQDRRDSIQYLAFIKPADNYMFKSQPARVFADYVEFGNDIGSGRSFRLDHYYRLCDEVLEVIEADEEMKSMLDEQIERRAKIDGMDADGIKNMPGKLRIVVYDIMYCGKSCGVYEGIPEPIKKVSKKNSKAGKANEKKKRIEELREEIDSKNVEIEELRNNIPDLPDFTGMELTKPFDGSGKVTKQEGNYIYIDINGHNKTLVLPDCIAKGYLTGADDTAVEICKQISEAMEKEKKLKSSIRYLEIQIGMIK